MSGRSPSLAARLATIRAFSHARRVHSFDSMSLITVPVTLNRPCRLQSKPTPSKNRALSHSARPPVGPRRPSPPTLCRAGRHVERASAGNGLSGHVSGELFKMMASVDMVHVPYRGEAPALTDLIGGQVQGDIRQLAHIDRAH